MELGSSSVWQSYGIAFIYSRVMSWGSLMASLWVFGFIISDDTGTLILSILGIGLSIFFGAKGNEMIAKNYLKHGWEFISPENAMVRIAKKQWRIETKMPSSQSYSFIE
jgi:hypothetical protein